MGILVHLTNIGISFHLLKAFGSLKNGVDSWGRCAVESGKSNLVLAAIGHQLQQIVAGNNTRGNDAIKSSHGDGLFENLRVLKRIKVKI